MMLTYGITAVIVFAWVSKMIAQKRFFVAHTPFDIPIGLFVLSQFVSTLFSMDPIVSWFGYYSRFNGGMLSIICYTLLFYAYVSNVKKAFGKKLLFSLLGSATIVSVYGVLQHVGIDKHIWVQDVQARVFSTLGQPNWLAAYLVALLPLVLSLAIIYVTLPKQFTMTMVFSVLLFLTLLYTKSRSGLAAFAGVDVLFWAILFLKKISWKTIRIPLVICHVAFVICVTVTGIGIPTVDKWITIEGIKNQLVKTNQPAPHVAPVVAGPVLETGGTESGVIRKYVWQAAINAWIANPKNMAFGTGTETFAFAFYQYKPLGHNLTSEWDFLYNKAHNEYLNFFATTGLFGLASYLILIGSVILWIVQYARRTALFIKIKKQPIVMQEGSILVYGLAAGWVSLLITNFFGFSVVVTQLLFFLFPAAMLVVRGTIPTKEWKKETLALRTQQILLVLTLVATTIAITLLSLSWFADKTFATGYRASRSGNYANAYAPLGESVRLNRYVPLYHDEYAVVLSSLALGAFESQDATLAGTLAVYALTENDNALRLSPNNVNFWKSRTKIFYALATIDESYLPQAIDALIHAQTLSPKDPKISYNLAILYGKLGDSQKAVDYLLEAKRLKPNYRDAYYALSIFYTETKQPDKAKEIITQYLTTIDSADVEFKKLVE
jgi:O-antigen ligase